MEKEVRKHRVELLISGLPKPVKKLLYDARILIGGATMRLFLLRVFLALSVFVGATLVALAQSMPPGHDEIASLSEIEFDSIEMDLSSEEVAEADAAIGHSRMEDFLAGVRAAHLRIGPPIAGLALDSNIGCASALTALQPKYLLICDPTPPSSSAGGGAYDACELARHTGYPVLSASPILLYKQLARLFNLLGKIPALQSLVFIGPLHSLELYGLPAHVAAHLPEGAALKGIDTTGAGALLVPGRRKGQKRAGFSAVTRVRRGYEQSAGGLPVLTGAGHAGSQLSYSALTGMRHIGLLISGDTAGEADSVALLDTELQSLLSSAHSNSNSSLKDQLAMHVLRVLRPGRSSLPQHNFAILGPRQDRYINLTSGSAVAASELSRYDAIVSLEGWTSGHGGQGGYDAELLQIAISAGVPVLVPQSSADDEMQRVGISSYDDALGARGLLAALQAEFAESAQRRHGRLGAYAQWQGGAREAWGRFISFTDSTDAALSPEEMLDASKQALPLPNWAPDLVSLGLTTSQARPSKTVAFLTRDLAPMRVGGQGTMTSLMAVDLLAAGHTVAMIADVPQCDDLAQWTFFAKEKADLDEEMAERQLKVYCVEEVYNRALKSNPALAGAMKRASQGGPYRESYMQLLFKMAVAVRYAYERSPFALLEAPDSGGFAFELLRARTATSNGSGYLPPDVAIHVRAHASEEAAAEFDEGALTSEIASAEPAKRRSIVGRAVDVARRVRLRHLAERFSIQAADAVLVPSHPMAEVYQRSYSLPPSRVAVALLPLGRLWSLHWPKVRVMGDEIDEDTDGEECGDELQAFPHPCSGRDDPTCATFLVYGRVDAVKGADVIASALAGWEHPRIEAHVIFLGPDGLCGPQSPGHAAAAAARKRGGGARRIGAPVHGPIRASECILASFPAERTHHVHFEPKMDPRCVGPVVQQAQPVAAVFGSRLETFHLAAHEMARAGAPLVLPDLPAYRGFFTDRLAPPLNRSDDGAAAESAGTLPGVYIYPSGDASALRSVLVALAESRFEGRPTVTVPVEEALTPTYHNGLAVYEGALEEAELRRATQALQPPSQPSEVNHARDATSLLAVLDEIGGLLAAVEQPRAAPCGT